VNETYEGRELLMKMKKKTWWGKGENRRAGSIELDDDTQDEPGGLLQPPAFVNQRSSASFFLRIREVSVSSSAGRKNMFSSWW
jgi:hypothetical protein